MYLTGWAGYVLAIWSSLNALLTSNPSARLTFILKAGQHRHLLTFEPNRDGLSHEEIDHSPFSFPTSPSSCMEVALTLLSSKPKRDAGTSPTDQLQLQLEAFDGTRLPDTPFIVQSSKTVITYPVSVPSALKSRPSCNRPTPQYRSREFSFSVGNEGWARRVA
ncbi:hypothetical protein PM082_001806 [Marasmius tenuissimus]|nr:hypothetical protein PM082_001806 [Marasmius tenuissimus]